MHPCKLKFLTALRPHRPRVFYGDIKSSKNNNKLHAACITFWSLAVFKWQALLGEGQSCLLPLWFGEDCRYRLWQMFSCLSTSSTWRMTFVFVLPCNCNPISNLASQSKPSNGSVFLFSVIRKGSIFCFSPFSLLPWLRLWILLGSCLSLRNNLLFSLYRSD